MPLFPREPGRDPMFPRGAYVQGGTLRRAEPEMSYPERVGMAGPYSPASRVRPFATHGGFEAGKFRGEPPAIPPPYNVGAAGVQEDERAEAQKRMFLLALAAKLGGA